MNDIMRVSRNNPCPICGHTDWCGYNQFVAICMRVDSEKQAGNGGFIHRLSKEMNVSYIPPEKTDNPIADIAVRDKIYRLLLSKLSLSDLHRNNLLKRGVDERFIQDKGYRTLPLEGRYALTKTLQEVVGTDNLLGVPGFYQAEGRNGPYWTLAGRPGMLIPTLNLRGQIQGLQIRVDNPSEKVKKYQWLSSFDRPGGTSSGVHIHVAIPRNIVIPGVIGVTEGPLKADIAAELLGWIFLAVPGVNNWRGVTELCMELGAKKVATTYDADLETNKYVRIHEQQMVEELTAAGIFVRRARWHLSLGKGIDDCLVAGYKSLIKYVA